MFYLIFPPDSAFSIMFNLHFICFSSYEGAVAFRDKYNCNAFISDTFPMILEAVNQDAV